MLGAVAELAVVVILVMAAVVLLRTLHRGVTSQPPPIATPAEPARWEPQVTAVDNQTVVAVRRASNRRGETADVLEIARFAADDPDWHDKLVAARAEASLRAAELNAPY